MIETTVSSTINMNSAAAIQSARDALWSKSRDRVKKMSSFSYGYFVAAVAAIGGMAMGVQQVPKAVFCFSFHSA